VDSGFAADDEVSHFYDPLLAKLIVHAETRDAAIKKMQTALRDFVVHGVTTNIDFMQTVLQHEDFENGKVSTRWVEKNLESGNLLPQQHTATGTRAVGFHTLIAAALTDVVFVNGKSQSVASNETDPFNPWKQTNNFRT